MSDTNITRVAQPSQRKVTGQWLLENGYPPLPVAPKQDAKKYPKKNKNGQIELDSDGNPKPLFTGKNPSYLDKNGYPHLVNHRQYQDKLPTGDEIKNWFANSLNGIGTLGGWNDTIWLDLDVKQFSDQEECDAAFYGFLKKNPELEKGFIEETHSGGYRIGVRVRQKPDFTNFTLKEGGKHVGEALGEGRFTVLSPTKGVSGNPYENISREKLPLVDSLESLGVYPVKKSNKPKITRGKITPPEKEVVLNALSLEEFVTNATRAILNGESNSDDRSAALTTAINDLRGWVNWCNENDVPYKDDYLELAHIAGGVLGIDEDRVYRILNTIDENCRPSAEYMGDDISCWKKIKKLSKKIFEAKCPEVMKIKIEQEIENWKKKPSGKNVKAGNLNDITSDENLVETTPEDTILKSLFEDGQGIWSVMNDAYFQYTEKGHWQYIEDTKVNKLIAQKLRRLYLQKKKGDDYIPEFKFATDRNKSSAFKFCRSALTEDTASIYSDHLICFKNCTVDVRTGEELPHDKGHLLTTAITCDYFKNAECPEIFKKFVEDVFGEEFLQLIRAITSMYLDPTAPYGYFAHVIGSSGSGKGTLLRFWGSMFGHSNMRSLSGFADISSPEGRHQFLTGARFISFPDLGGYQRDLRAFYELVDNGSMSGRALFSSSGYEKRWSCRFAMASVDHLSIENSGDGWDRRCIPLPTKIRSNSVDPDLGKRLEEVRGEVISWALSMPRNERNHLIMNASANEKIKNLKREQAVFGDSVKAFIDATLRPGDAKATLQNHTLHDWYVAFCKANGFSPMSSTKFLSHFKNVLPQNHVPRKQYRESGKVVSIPAHWGHIRLVHPLAMKNHDVLGVQCQKEHCSQGGLEEFEEFWGGVTGVTGNPTDGSEKPVTAETQAQQASQEPSQPSQPSQGNSRLAKFFESKDEYPPHRDTPHVCGLYVSLVNSACDACDSGSNPVTASVTGQLSLPYDAPVTPVTPVTLAAAEIEILLESPLPTWDDAADILKRHSVALEELEGRLSLEILKKLQLLSQNQYLDSF